jgi:TorA maturation chaperone TorD
MPSSSRLRPSSLSLLSFLWLHEPDDGVLTRATSELSLPFASPAELAPAFTHLFLLNVFPYGDVFTTPTAEMNGPGAERASQGYADHAFAPPELSEVAAPDHLGLQLAFLDHLATQSEPVARAAALAELLAWAPAVCFAVQREPDVHAFYLALAQATLTALLAEAPTLRAALPDRPLEPGPLPDPTGETRLRDLVAFFLAPARCGLWLSRGRLGALAHSLGLALPFGPRPDVAEALFAAAGSAGVSLDLIRVLEDELSAWNRSYDMQPLGLGWPLNGHWQARTHAAEGQLIEMRVALQSKGWQQA